jgi:hypothetical protein
MHGDQTLGNILNRETLLSQARFISIIFCYLCDDCGQVTLH